MSSAQRMATEMQTRPFMKNPRLPRFRRAKNPPPMELTGRDREILRQVHLFRVLTREQIERLLFAPDHGQDHATKTSKVRQRLKLLYHHGYLQRLPVPVEPGAWAWRPVYRLGRKGAQLLAAERGIQPSELAYWGQGDDRDHRKSDASLLFLAHTLAVNDVRVATTLAAQAYGYRIEKWLDETTLKRDEWKEYVSVSQYGGRSARVPVIPDAYFVLHLGDRRAHFFLELDWATMSTERWQNRSRAYLEYVHSGRYQARYQTHSLRILTVTTTEQRLLHLKETTERAGGNELFWFTTLELATKEDIFFRPIWQVAGARDHTTLQPLLG